MAGKIKLTFHRRMFLLVLALCWIPAVTLMVFQYQREKDFKNELLNARLQTINAQIATDLRRGADLDSIARTINSDQDADNHIRISIIDQAGNVVFDSNSATPHPGTNHNDRAEVAAARSSGTGYTVERHSQSDGVDYFYSAMLSDDNIIVRTAAPYTHSLNDMLRADRSMLWIMSAITLIISLIAYLATRKITMSIARLNRFAAKADSGQPLSADEAFPDDELGSIAGHIVRLYVQSDERYREALRLQREKTHIKKQLTNNINHELKTPVASIIACLELLRDHPELDNVKKNEFLNRIHDNARRLEALLRDVAKITRMDDGADRIEKTAVNLTHLIEEIASDERLRTNMSIITKLPAELTVNGNRQLLESIFRNLIDNAIAYSGGSEIIISADDKGNFTVSDNGCGIPDEHLPHIFERFYRIDKGRSRAAGGTGLGLSIVRNAVAIHGGDISVTNCSGLRFDFYIPPIDDRQ